MLTQAVLTSYLLGQVNYLVNQTHWRDSITQLNKGIKEISTQLNISSQQKEEITQLATSLDEFE